MKYLNKQVINLIVFTFLATSFLSSVHAQKLSMDKILQKQLSELITKFHGTAGVFVQNLKTGKFAAVNADTIFPTASIIKVPILFGIFSKIQNGELSYHQPLLYKDSMARGGSGLMGFFKDSTKTSLDILISLMIGYSDNTAAVWGQSLAGGGEQINLLMEKLGLQNTRVNSRTKGRDEQYDKYGWGQTTPREMAHLMILIRQGKAISQAASDCMYRHLTHIFYNGYALSQIPPYVQTASKQGMVNASRSELVLVNAPHGDYVFYVATKNNQDQRWQQDNEAWVLARQISALLWHHFEAKSKWDPANGSEKFSNE